MSTSWTRPQFAKSIRDQYPGKDGQPGPYDDWSDGDLTNAMIEKFPVYKNQVETPQQSMKRALPSTFGGPKPTQLGDALRAATSSQIAQSMQNLGALKESNPTEYARQQALAKETANVQPGIKYSAKVGVTKDVPYSLSRVVDNIANMINYGNQTSPGGIALRMAQGKSTDINEIAKQSPEDTAMFSSYRDDVRKYLSQPNVQRALDNPTVWQNLARTAPNVAAQLVEIAALTPLAGPGAIFLQSFVQDYDLPVKEQVKAQLTNIAFMGAGKIGGRVAGATLKGSGMGARIARNLIVRSAQGGAGYATTKLTGGTDVQAQSAGALGFALPAGTKGLGESPIYEAPPRPVRGLLGAAPPEFSSAGSTTHTTRSGEVTTEASRPDTVLITTQFPKQPYGTQTFNTERGPITTSRTTTAFEAKPTGRQTIYDPHSQNELFSTMPVEGEPLATRGTQQLNLIYPAAGNPTGREVSIYNQDPRSPESVASASEAGVASQIPSGQMRVSLETAASHLDALKKSTFVLRPEGFATKPDGSPIFKKSFKSKSSYEQGLILDEINRLSTELPKSVQMQKPLPNTIKGTEDPNAPLPEPSASFLTKGVLNAPQGNPIKSNQGIPQGPNVQSNTGEVRPVESQRPSSSRRISRPPSEPTSKEVQPTQTTQAPSQKSVDPLLQRPSVPVVSSEIRSGLKHLGYDNSEINALPLTKANEIVSQGEGARIGPPKVNDALTKQEEIGLRSLKLSPDDITNLTADNARFLLKRKLGSDELGDIAMSARAGRIDGYYWNHDITPIENAIRAAKVLHGEMTKTSFTDHLLGKTVEEPTKVSTVEEASQPTTPQGTSGSSEAPQQQDPLGGSAVDPGQKGIIDRDLIEAPWRAAKRVAEFVGGVKAAPRPGTAEVLPPPGSASNFNDLSGVQSITSTFKTANKVLLENEATRPLIEGMQRNQDKKIAWIGTTLRDFQAANKNLGSLPERKLAGELANTKETPAEMQSMLGKPSPLFKTPYTQPAIDAAIAWRQKSTEIHALFPPKAGPKGRNVGYLQNYLTNMESLVGDTDLQRGIQQVWDYNMKAPLQHFLDAFKKPPLDPTQEGKGFDRPTMDPSSPYVRNRSGRVKDLEYDIQRIERAYVDSAAKVIFDRPMIQNAKLEAMKLPQSKIREFAISTIKNAARYDAHPELDRAWGQLTSGIVKTYARSVLGLNPVVAGYHAYRLFTDVWPAIETKYLAQGAKTFFQSPVKSMQETARLGLIPSDIKPWSFKTFGEKGNALLQLFSIGDYFSRSVGYQSFLAKYKAEGLSPEEATLKAITQTKNTTQLVDPIRTQRLLFGKGPDAGLIHLLTQFKQQPTMIAEQYIDVLKNWKGGPAALAKLAASLTAGIGIMHLTGYKALHLAPSIWTSVGGGAGEFLDATRKLGAAFNDMYKWHSTDDPYDKETYATRARQNIEQFAINLAKDATPGGWSVTRQIAHGRPGFLETPPDPASKETRPRRVEKSLKEMILK